MNARYIIILRIFKYLVVVTNFSVGQGDFSMLYNCVCFVTHFFNISLLFNVPRGLFSVLHLDHADALDLKLDDLGLPPSPALAPGAGPHLLCSQTPGPVSAESGGVRQVPAGGNV